MSTHPFPWAKPAACAVAAVSLAVSSLALALPASAASANSDESTTSGIGPAPEGFPTKSLKALSATAVNAQPGNTKMYLNWGTVDGASSYKVTTERADNGAKVGTTLSVTPSAATVSSLANGTEYVFTVTAVVGGNEQVVGAVGATPQPVAPQPTAAPTLSVNTRSTLTVAFAALSSTGISPLTGYQVRFAPADGSDPVIVATDAATLKATATDLTPGESYRVEYAGVNLVNGEPMVGPYSAKALTAVPSGAPAPANVRAIAEGNHSVTLKWEPVTDATKYTVYYKPTDGSAAEKNLSTAAATGSVPAPSTLKVTGLTNNLGYNFQVAATTVIGSTAKIGDRSAVVGAAPISPAAPADLRVTGIGSGKAYLDWSPVPGAESYYLKAEVLNANGVPAPAVPAAVKIATTATATQKVISGLSNGVEYRIRVATTTEGVAGDYTNDAASTSVTPLAVPGTTNPTKVAVAPTSISIKWVAPTAVTGVDPADRYRVTYTPSNGGAAIVHDEVGTLSDIATGLVTGVTYTISIQAGNAAGYGMSSTTPLVLVASDKPGAVRNPSVDRSVDGTVAGISWDTPDYTGGTSIKSYTVTPKQTNPVGTAPAAKTVTSGNFVNFTGLVAGADYTFTITATTDSGTGASVIVGSLADGPNVSEPVVYNYDNGSVAMTWTKAANSRLSYQAQATQIPFGASSTTIVLPATQTCDAATCTAVFDKFADNINGEYWSFRVRATDSVYSTSSWRMAPVQPVTGTTTVIPNAVYTCPEGTFMPPGTELCRTVKGYTYHTENVRYSIGDRWYLSDSGGNWDNGTNWRSCTYYPSGESAGKWGCSEGHYEWRQEVRRDATPDGYTDDGTQWYRDEAAPNYSTYSLSASFPWTTAQRAANNAVNFVVDGLPQADGKTLNLGRCPGTLNSWLTGLGGSGTKWTGHLCN